MRHLEILSYARIGTDCGATPSRKLDPMLNFKGYCEIMYLK